MIQWGQRSGQVRAIFEGQNGPVDIQVKLQPGRAREMRLDSAVVRLRDLVGRVPLVQLRAGRSLPRQRGAGSPAPDLNMALCQVDRSYMDSLQGVSGCFQAEKRDPAHDGPGKGETKILRWKSGMRASAPWPGGDEGALRDGFRAGPRSAKFL